MARFPLIFERALAATPGWVLFSAGLVIIIASVLLPAWRATDALQVKRDHMSTQVEWIAQQRQTYDRVLVAMEQDDPILLKRLAYHHLRLKPAEATLIDVQEPNAMQPGVRNVLHPAPGVARSHHRLVESLNSVEDWAFEPLPVALAPEPTLATMPSRLNRLTTGTTRLFTAAFGMLCLIAGVWFHHNARAEMDD